jgi:hypothetical protein
MQCGGGFFPDSEFALAPVALPVAQMVEIRSDIQVLVREIMRPETCYRLLLSLPPQFREGWLGLVE